MKQLLAFLYQFHENGDYAPKSLNDFFANSSTKWNDVKSIRDIRSRITDMVKYKQISIDGDMELFKYWGEINEGETFDYIKNPISAVILEKGINIIEHVLEKERQKQIDQSVLDTNNSVVKINKLFWITALIAASSSAASIRSCQLTNQQNKSQTELSSKNSTIEELKNKLSQKENVQVLHPSSKDSAK
jgi:hypothetical protein